MKNIDWNKLNHYIIASIFAGLCGIFTFATLYFLLGFITEPIKNWLNEKVRR